MASDWEAKLAEYRWKYVPTAKRFLLYASKYIVRDKGRDAVAVLVDAKEEGGAAALTPDLMALTTEVPEGTWQFLRRTSGVWTVDEIAADLDLPTFERIEEINEQFVWDSARAVSEDTESNEFMDAQSDAIGEIYKQWSNAVIQAAATALYPAGLDLTDDDMNAITFVPISSGPPAEVKRNPWKVTGRNIANELDVEEDLTTYGEKEFLRKYDASTWREYAFNCIDSLFEIANKHDARRRYDRAF